MGRSLKVSPEFITRVKSSLERNGYRSQQVLGTDIGFFCSTLKNFLNDKRVDYLNFIELCEKLGLEALAFGELKFTANSLSYLKMTQTE